MIELFGNARRLGMAWRIRAASCFMLLVLGLLFAPAQLLFAAANVYYVDSFHGNDANPGLSPSKAWRSLDRVNSVVFQPGDKILFSASGVWNGMLAPQGSGTPEHSIVIDSYGEGPRPEIVGNGRKAAVLLRNQQYWEIQGLSITNSAATPGFRAGVLIEADTPGETIHHVYLRNLVVRDVSGHLGADLASKNTGGIGFYAAGKVQPSKFDDIAVEHCVIENTDSSGIWIDDESGVHPRSPGWSSDHNSRVRILGNTLSSVGKNSIIVRSSLDPLIQSNVVRDSAARLHGNAIVIFSSKGAIVRQNDVSGTHYYGLEGAAYDSDYNSEGTVIEYNLSQNNGGGLVDLCSNPEEKSPMGYNNGSIVRYNISQNDVNRVFGFDGPVTNTQIYNNSVYIGEKQSPHIVDFDLFGKAPGYASHTEFINNVIDNAGDGNYKWSGGMDYRFEANCFLGNQPENAPQDTTKIISGAGFTSAPVDSLNALSISGYTLVPKSLCLGSGVAVADNGNRDIVGNPLPLTAPDRGAIQSSTLAYRLLGGIPYAHEGGEELVADLYLPKGDGPFPAVVYLHGGGWSGGNRKQLRRQAAYMASHGVAGMAIEYRLAPQFHYPDDLYDAKESVRWLRENAGKYRIDPSRIAAVGSSAGGHLAAMLGVTGGDATLEGNGCCKQYSSKVQAVVVFNGIFDLTAMSHREPMITRYLSVKCEDDLSLCKAASPINHVAAVDPPFLIMHGTADQTAPYSQAMAMVQKLKAAGVHVELFTAPGAPHTFWASKEWYLPSQNAMQQFLDKYLLK